MAKHNYLITINNPPRGGLSHTFKFGSTDGIVIQVARGKASAAFRMTGKKTFEDIVSFRVRLVKDALRKIYLLHAFGFDESLYVRSITVSIDGEERVFDDSDEGFPYLFSMIKGKGFGLPEQWRQESFLKSALLAKKSQAQDDRKYACLFAFLSGLGKRYEIDRFTCFWTAMNAHYGYLGECYKVEAVRKFRCRDYPAVPKGDRISWRQDAVAIGALIRMLDMGDGKPKNGSDQYRTDYGALKTYFMGLSAGEIKALYDDLYAHRTDRTYAPEGKLGAHLSLCIQHAGISAYAFVLLEYAYYMRCKYLHGARTTMLFAAHQDVELAAFRVLNYFLSEYLKQVIPEMFAPDYFTEEMYNGCKEK